VGGGGGLVGGRGGKRFICALCLTRKNQLGPKAWEAIVDALERCPDVVVLNGSDKYRAVRAGGLSDFNDEGHELALAMSRFLPRSASTLTSLHLKYLPLAHLSRLSVSMAG
jgi:hypothetical protein